MVGVQRRAEGVQQILTTLSRSKESKVRSEVVLGPADGPGRSGKRLADVAGASPAVVTMLADLYADAERATTDSEAPVDRRARSILLIAQRPFDQSRAILAPLLDPREPAKVQSATVRVLASYRDLDVVGLLLSRSP